MMSSSRTSNRMPTANIGDADDAIKNLSRSKVAGEIIPDSRAGSRTGSRNAQHHTPKPPTPKNKDKKKKYSRQDALEPACLLYEEIEALKRALMIKHADVLLKNQSSVVRACEWAVGRLETTCTEIELLDKKLDDSLQDNEMLMVDMYKDQMTTAKDAAFFEIHNELQTIGLNLNQIKKLKAPPAFKQPKRRGDGAPKQFDGNQVPESVRLEKGRQRDLYDAQSEFDPHRFRKKYGLGVPKSPSPGPPQVPIVYYNPQASPMPTPVPPSPVGWPTTPVPEQAPFRPDGAVPHQAPHVNDRTQSTQSWYRDNNERNRPSQSVNF